jgi:hypothetical protein
MSLHNYLESFRQAIEKIENYGYTESVEIKEELSIQPFVWKD